MTHRRPPSIALPIVLGSLLIACCLALATLWNVVIVVDYLKFRAMAEPTAAVGPGRWILLAVGCVLFVGVLVGLVMFLISLVRQIRMNRAQQNFIDSVTHELKTPLTSLKLHLQTLQRGNVPLERQGEFHGIMLMDVERLDSLLDHVLTAARLERKEEVDLAAIELRELIQGVVGEVEARYALGPGAITLEGPPLRLRSDFSSLHMVFLNLVDNAVKYSVDPVRVEILLAPLPKGGATVRVRDHGLGIPRKAAKRIFQRFYRVGHELTRKRPGTGLGLYIARELVHAVGGRIKLESTVQGQGTTFVVRLPGGRGG